MEKYTDFGPTFASEKLAEVHGLKISVGSVRKALSAAFYFLPLIAIKSFSSDRSDTEEKVSSGPVLDSVVK